MTTLSPQKSALLSHTMPGSRELVAALLPWRRRLILQQTQRRLIQGSIAALISACLVILIARLQPWAHALIWAEGLALFCLALAVGLAIRSRPSLARTALLVDRRLGLHDRLGTAWELREESSPLAGLQRRDALKHLKDFTPATAISLRPTRTVLLTLVAFVLALALLVVLPNPMDHVLQQQAALQARIAKQVAAVEHIRQELAQSPTLTKQQQQQLDQILQELTSKLQQAKSDTEAQQAIAQAQTKIDQLRNPQTAQNTQAQDAAGNALQNSNDPALKEIGQALANNDPQSLATALQKLAAEVSKMTPQQRSNVAQQLEQAANQASQNAQMSSALRDLAKSLTDGNTAEQEAASKEVQSAAAQNAQNQAKEQGLNQISQDLQQAANSLAATSDGTQSQQAEASQQGQAATEQGKTNQQGQSQQGQQGQGQGNGTKGSNGTGKNEQVYVPGQLGSGTSQQTSDQGNGVVQAGSDVPYSQVIAQYDQMAHDAIDNSDISPDLKDLVHEYFNSLEGQ
ncbi:MAG TPA: hypothetical protein VGN34_29305 [Ktedonobacteraceae bacterium]|jgi:septal ring factor EnvC (AmiA/AmiB activator)